MRAFSAARLDSINILTASTVTSNDAFFFPRHRSHDPPPSGGGTRAAIRVLEFSACVCSTRFKAGISRRTFFVEQATLSLLSHAPWAYSFTQTFGRGLSMPSQRSG
jgi:hypothetical protein